MTLGLYIAERFIRSFVRVLLIVLMLIFLFQFIENLRKFGELTESLRPLFELTLFQVPSSLNRLFPLVMLLSSLTLFLGLARASELVVTRAAGVSALRMVFIPICVAIIFGFIATAVFNPIVAATTKRHDLLEDAITNTNRSVLSVSGNGVWLRQSYEDQQAVIQARRSSPDGATLFGVEFHIFNDAGVLVERVAAQSATLREGRWILVDVRRWFVVGNSSQLAQPIRRSNQDTISTDLTPSQIIDSFAPPQTISFWDLRKFIDNLEQSGFSAVRHKQYYQSALAAPALFTAMVLIGAGVTMRHVRFGNVGVMVLVTVLAGFVLYSLNNVFTSFGAAGSIPTMMAAWTPSLAAIMLVLGLLLHLEDG